MPFTAQIRPVTAFGTAVLVLLALAPSALAQSAATGTIEGRVLNAANGVYLNKAHVMVQGGQAETLTDQLGYYRLTNVPAGPVKLSVFYTGLAPNSQTVTVPPGTTLTRDVSLFEIGSAAVAEGEALKLDPYVVQAQREMTGAAIAINEQRYATNVKVVVATDEFGDIVDGNVGEFLQYLPGVTADNAGSSEPKIVSIRGLPPGSTPILINGFQLASASESNQSRQVYLADNSINTMSRIEVNLSNTPDQRADAIGGSVNMITRSALEYAQPRIDYRLYGTYRDGEGLFSRTPGPTSNKSNKTSPGADLTWIFPVNPRFGITVNLSHNREWGPQEYEGMNWSPNGAAVTGTGLFAAPVASPFMYRYNPMIGQGFTTRNAAGLTLDFKLSDRDVLSFAAAYGYFDLAFYNRAVTFNAGGVTSAANYGPGFTHGVVGGGLISLLTGAGQQDSFRHEFGTTVQPMLIYRHNGPVWRIDAGGSASRNSNHYRDTADGFFQAMEITMGRGVTTQTFNNTPNNGVTNPIRGAPITINYDGINKNNPGTIQVLDANGNSLDPNDLNNYTIRGASANPRDSSDLVKQFIANAQRDFDLNRLRLTTRMGVDIRQQTRDITSLVDGHGPQTWTFVGADGVPGTADDSAAVLADPDFSSVHMPFGGPVFSYPSPFKLYQLYQAHPEYFVANTLGEFINDANNSSRIQETVSAGYFRADAHLFNNRLLIVGGARYEETSDQGQGLLQTNSTTVTTLAQAQARYIPRGLHANVRYGGFYPSLNATWYFAPETMVRVAYGRTLFRPDFNNIIPGATLPTNGSGTIPLNNTKLQPWTANNYEVSLEHYFKDSAGLVTVGFFRRDISNFFATVTRPITADDEATYNIDPAIYGNDLVTTLVNVSNARITGFDYNYRQALPFLPGLQVFTNGTVQHLSGPAIVPSTFAAGGSSQTNFQNFINKTFSTGLSYSRGKYLIKVDWLYRSLERGGIAVTATTSTLVGGPASYNVSPPKNYLNLAAEYRMIRHVGLFFAVRNTLNQPENTMRYVTGVTPDYARLYSQAEFKTLYVFGLKGEF